MGIFSRKKTTAAPATDSMQESAKVAVKNTVAAQPAAKSPVVKSTNSASVVTPTVVLLRPLVTEKATVTGTYIFKVGNAVTKSEVSKAFKAKYGKTPRKVNMLNVMGKTKMRGRQVGQRSNWKKAIVYLTKGETVDLYQ